MLLVTFCAAPWPAANAQPAPATLTEVTAPLNEFGLRLLRTLSDGKGANVIISPLSVSLALAMTYNGASGATRTAIAKTLGIATLDDRDSNRDNRALIDTIQKADPAIQIEIANALWTRSGFPINHDFLQVSRDFFNASAESLNFAGDPDGAAGRINTWIKERTHGKIPTIVRNLARSTALVLTDAVYFKGRWSVSFKEKQTMLRSFHFPDGGSVATWMMRQDGEFDYLETPALQAIRLPYGDRRFAMYVFLPRPNPGLPEFLRSLDEAHWLQWMPQFHPRRGQIVLPRFESTYGQKLNGALELMGMRVAFGPDANFSRIHQPPPQLTISDVEHKTYVKVDEEGTEAAAATSIGIVASAIIAAPPPQFKMVVDHPFFCAIAEQQSGALLFAGVVTNPTRH